jgi:hypothetical protein
MENAKKRKARPTIALLVVVAVFLFFYRSYHRDVRALTDFSVSCEKFDQAISGFSRLVSASSSDSPTAADVWESRADEALGELKTNALFRLSSLIKNDAELMSTALEISDLSGKELAALKAFRRAASEKNVDLDRPAIEVADLSNQRQTVWARFKELGPKRPD